MAAKKISGTGLTKLAGMVLGKKPTTKKKTTSKKTKPKVAAIGRAESVSRFESKTSITYTNSSSKNSLKSLQNGLQRLVDSISINSKWNRIGGITADLLEREGKDFLDVSDESESINTNFNVLTNQINVLSNFMIRLDSKFTDLQKNIKTNLVKTTSELAKSQIVVINQVDKQIKKFDENLDKLQSRIDIHDRQLDEIYAETKARQKQEQAKNFLAGKRLPKTAQDHIKEIDPGSSSDSSGLDIQTVGKFGAAGAAAAIGAKLAVKGAAKGVAAGAALTKRVTKTGFMRLITIVEKRLGAAAAKKLAVLAGSAWLGPAAIAVAIGLSLYEAYDIWKEFTSTNDTDFNGVDKTESVQDISIVSSKNILIESKKKLTLKAETIVLDAKKIEFTGTVQSDSKQKVDAFKAQAQNKGGLFGWGGFPGHESKVVPGSKPDFLPGPSSGAFSSGGGGKRSSGGGSLGTGDWNVNSAIAGQKPNKQISKPESVLSDIISKSAPVGDLKVDKNNKVNPQELYNTLVNKFSKSELNGFVPPGGEKWGITKGTPQEWAKFGVANARQESGFNTKSTNLSDPGGSFGIYQFNQKQFGLNGNAYDPNASTDAFVKSMEHYAKKSNKWGSGIDAAGAIFGSIRRPNETLQHYKWVDKNIKQNEISDKAVLPGMSKIAAVDDKNRSLIQKARQKRSDYRAVANPEGPSNDILTNRVRSANERLENSPRVRELQAQLAATRRRALDPRLRKVLEYTSAKTGVEIDVFSGGQAGIGERGPRTGSTRHDHGNAADVNLYVRDEKGNRRKLDMTSESDRSYYENVVRTARSAGATGIGGEASYMGTNSLHIGFGKEAVWGAGKSSAGAYGWMRKAFNEGAEQEIDIDKIDIEALTKKEKRSVTPGIDKLKQVVEKNQENRKTVPIEKRGIAQFAGLQKPQKSNRLSTNAGEKQLEKINNVMQSVEAKRAEFHKNPDYKRRPDGPDKKTTYLNNLSDKQKRFALAKTEAANPALGKKIQIYDGRDRVISLPGKQQWAQGGAKSIGPAWHNKTVPTVKTASVAPGIQQLSKITKTKQKVAEVKNAPKQVNVAQNGAISGGKPVQTKMVEEKKPEVKVAQKTEKKTEEAPKKQSKPEKDYTGFREREQTTPYNNSADSIPAGPADNGSGDYKHCLI